jgi:hypothetical protein
MINTKMNTADGDLPVERVEVPEHFATEPNRAYATSMDQRFAIPAYGPVRNLAVVVLTTSANRVDRERALAQLRKMAGDDEQAQAALNYIGDVKFD